MPFSKESALKHLLAAQQGGRLAHAHLFTGPVGSGKGWLAEQLAAEFIGCPASAVLTHPDIHILQPESKSRRIVIDQIRRLEDSVHRKPFVAKGKVVIIHDADRLRPEAANAFLKTLEEPPPESLILLLSSLPEAILETVLSRCVETSLEGRKEELSAEEKSLLEAVDSCLLGKNAPSAADAFRLTRTFQALLTDVREKITKELETSLKAEAARYKQTSEGGDWLQERTEQVKALSESSALRERDKLIGTLTVVFGDALRVQQGQPAQHPTAERMAKMLPAPSLFRCMDSVETMRRRLALGVQEALALEAGILETTLAAVRDTPCETATVSK
jgi:DNA polymerase-3 subunit delta'